MSNTVRTRPPLTTDEFWSWLFAESVAAGDDVGDIARVYGVDPATVIYAARMPDALRGKFRERQRSYERWALRLRRGTCCLDC